MHRKPAVVFGMAGALSPLIATARQCEPAWVRRATTGPSARHNAAMVYDSARQRVVLFGGDTGGGTSNPSGETWEWDGTAWTQRLVAGPPARSSAAMVYDSDRQRVVMYGGTGADVSVWEWDGTAWIQRVVPGPGPRPDSCAAYDSGRRRTVLATGENSHDTWEWDGTSWTRRTDTGPYVNANNSAMIYDPALGRCVLLPRGQNAGVPWESWDGSTWSAHDYPGLRPFGSQAGNQWVYDSARGRSVYLGDGNLTDLQAWEWDGAGWTFRGAGATARGGHAVAYDAARGRVVMFGGQYSSGLFGDTWEFNPGVNTGPAFSLQPFGIVVPEGGAIVLRAAATGWGVVRYRWQREGVPLIDGGSISGSATAQLTISPATAADSASYTVVATDDCASLTSRSAWVRVWCYPNCDGSTNPPRLNVLDFACFLNAMAVACSTPYECYPNCDGNTAWPYLNVLDFACFLNRYAAGCS